MPSYILVHVPIKSLLPQHVMVPGVGFHVRFALKCSTLRHLVEFTVGAPVYFTVVPHLLEVLPQGPYGCHPFLFFRPSCALGTLYAARSFSSTVLFLLGYLLGSVTAYTLF